MLNKLKDRFEIRTKDVEGQLIFYVKLNACQERGIAQAFAKRIRRC